MYKMEVSLFNNKEVASLAHRASTIAASKGFHEESNPARELWLMITELAEATEADRESKSGNFQAYLDVVSGKQNLPVTIEYDNGIPVKSYVTPEGDESCSYSNVEQIKALNKVIPTVEGASSDLAMYLAAAYKFYVKDSFNAELAGFFVRIGDFMGTYSIKGVTVSEDKVWETQKVSDTSACFLQMSGQIFAIALKSAYVAEGAPKYENEDFSILLSNAIFLCKKLNIDIWEHVKHELAFFETRPVKHGKKY